MKEEIKAAPEADVAVEAAEKVEEVAVEAAPEADVAPAKTMTAQEALNAAAELAAKLPAHAGKSAAEHGREIANKIRDLIKP